MNFPDDPNDALALIGRELDKAAASGEEYEFILGLRESFRKLVAICDEALSKREN